MRATLHRLAALVILLALLTGAGATIAVPLLVLRQSHTETLADLGDRLMRIRAVNARRANLLQRLADMEASDRTPAKLLSENSAALAAAALQSRLKRLAERSGSALTSSQVQSVTQDSLFERVPLRLQMNGDIAALHGFMRLVESETPSIFVNSLQISPVSRNKNSANDIYAPLPLQWVVEVHAYRRGERK